MNLATKHKSELELTTVQFDKAMTQMTLLFFTLDCVYNGATIDSHFIHFEYSLIYYYHFSFVVVANGEYFVQELAILQPLCGFSVGLSGGSFR